MTEVITVMDDGGEVEMVLLLLMVVGMPGVVVMVCKVV